MATKKSTGTTSKSKKKVTKDSNVSEELLRNKSDTAYSVPNLNAPFNDVIPPKNRIEEKRDNTFRCCTCGKKTVDHSLFPTTFSNTYAGLDFHLPICKNCLDALYENLNRKLDNPYETFRRLCMNFDVYYNDKIVNTTLKLSRTDRRMSCYISKACLRPYTGKTYADTIVEEKIKADDEKKKERPLKENTPYEYEISEEDRKMWGFGFPPEEVEFLNNKYSEWTISHECNTHAQEIIFKQMCMLELQILKAQIAGNSTVALQKQLNEFMNSANVQPKQNNDNALVEANTFGTLIKKWENERPIAKPAPEWEDVDYIKKYISVYYLGHLANMIGIKNKLGDEWSRLYDEEIEKNTVKPPSYFEEEADTPSFEEVFTK